MERNPQGLTSRNSLLLREASYCKFCVGLSPLLCFYGGAAGEE
jgi:hypothetical protein